MKRLKFPVFILMLLFQSALCFGQKTEAPFRIAATTKAPFTVTVYKVVGTGWPITLGAVITANSQILANTVYWVKVVSSTTGLLCCMRMTNADGFTTGGYTNNVWIPRADPTGYQADLGSVKQMGFCIKTFASPDFVNQLYMKVSQCTGVGYTCANPGGGAQGWLVSQPFLFPYP